MTCRAVTLALAMLLLSYAAPLSAAMRCEELTSLSIPATTVTGAQRVAAGTFAPPAGNPREAAARAKEFAALPAFCRVMLTARPSADSDIRMEVWLPETGWNNKLEAVGDGGLAGSIPMPLMAEALAEGYATAGTDTGHMGGTADFMPAHPEKLVDFAYRSTHELAVASKAVVTAFYGTPARWSYYNACSGGGRHAITSAQRFPADFDGIVAGAASWNQARLDAGRIGINLTVNRSPESAIPSSKYPMVHAAVLKACDMKDGVADGVIENPHACNFDYATLTCAGPAGPNCLTKPQVESARIMTSPFVDAATGRTLLEPHLWPGSELQWGTLGGPQPLANSLSRVRHFHLKDPAYQFRLANVAADIERAAQMDGGLIASSNADLRPFFGRGGKLLMWHGWGDPQVPAENSVIYFNNVVKTVGSSADGSLALFMLPGVLHCGGGEGPDTFDRMAAITRWVEGGQKPQRIVASLEKDGKVARTRPLCPFPQVAKYKGTGDTNSADSFACAVDTPASR